VLFGLDFDFDLDFDIDVDADSGFDASGLDLEDVSNVEIKDKAIVGDSKKKLKWWQILLIYFNFSELPFLFTFTSWISFWWILTIIGTYYTNSYDNSFGLIVLLTALVVSLIINKIFTNPFKANISKDKLGSVKLFVENDPINIYAKSLDGETIKSGQEVLIIKESSDKKFYYIKTYN